MRKAGTSVIRTISLIQYASDQSVDKGVRIIEVVLYSPITIVWLNLANASLLIIMLASVC